MMHYENLVCVVDYIYVETRDTLLFVGHLYDQHNLWILVLPYQHQGSGTATILGRRANFWTYAMLKVDPGLSPHSKL